MAIITKVSLVIGEPGKTEELPPGSYTAAQLKGLDLKDLVKRGFAEEVEDEAPKKGSAKAAEASGGEA